MSCQVHLDARTPCAICARLNAVIAAEARQDAADYWLHRHGRSETRAKIKIAARARHQRDGDSVFKVAPDLSTDQIATRSGLGQQWVRKLLARGWTAREIVGHLYRRGFSGVPR